MTPNLFIRYTGVDPRNESELALGELGESLIGFETVFKEFAAVLRVEGEFEVKATATRQGSIIIDLIVNVQNSLTGIPFESVEDFLNVLKIAGDPLWDSAVTYFNSLVGAQKSLNDFASQRPVDFAVIVAILGKAMQQLLKKVRKNKQKPDFHDPDLPKKVAEELHKLIKQRKFKKALKPIVDDQAKSIEVSTERSFKEAAKIDQENFQDYLAEDDKILPHLENGKTYTLTGKVTSLKGTRGDSLTFQLHHGREDYNLDAAPADGATSKNYRQFYQEGVQVEAMVIRDSLYKKPKLKLINIHLNQGEFPQDVIQPEDTPSNGHDGKEL